MLDSSDPSPPRPVMLDYSAPPQRPRPSRASYVAMITGVLAGGFFLLLVNTFWRGVAGGARGHIFYLWIVSAAVGLVAGVRGLRDVRNLGGVGRGMSWVGVSAGGLTFLLLLAAPLGGINISLMAGIALLALIALRK